MTRLSQFMPYSQHVFGDEISSSAAVFKREVEAGMNRLAYVLAKDTIELVAVVLKPLVFLLGWSMFNMPRGSLWSYMAAAIAGSYAGSGFAFAASVLFEPHTAQLVAAVAILITGLQANKNSSFLLPLNLVAHLLRAMLFAELGAYNGSMLVRRCVSLGAFGDLTLAGGLLVEIGWLLGIGAFFRLAAFAALVLKTLRPRRRAAAARAAAHTRRGSSL